MRNLKFITFVSWMLLLALGGMISHEALLLNRSKSNSEKIKNPSPFNDQLFSSFEEADDDVDIATLQVPEDPHFVIGHSFYKITPTVILLFLLLCQINSAIGVSRNIKFCVLRI